jgi:hypothetical protein
MNEYIPAAAVRREETVTLRRVKPLHLPTRHFALPTEKQKVNRAGDHGATEKGQLRALTGNVKPRMRLRRLVGLLPFFDEKHVCVRRLSRNRRPHVTPRDDAGRRASCSRKTQRLGLMAPGQSPVHLDAASDIAVHGYCFFQVVV